MFKVNDVIRKGKKEKFEFEIVLSSDPTLRVEFLQYLEIFLDGCLRTTTSIKLKDGNYEYAI